MGKIMYKQDAEIKNKSGEIGQKRGLFRGRT